MIHASELSILILFVNWLFKLLLLHLLSF